MKSKITLIIAAFAILISFAFVTANKNHKKATDTVAVQQDEQSQPMSGYAMEDQNQWD